MLIHRRLLVAENTLLSLKSSSPSASSVHVTGIASILHDLLDQSAASTRIARDHFEITLIHHQALKDLSTNHIWYALDVEPRPSRKLRSQLVITGSREHAHRYPRDDMISICHP